MDVSSILGQIFNNEQLGQITKLAGISEADTTNILSKALPLVAGTTTQRGFDLGSLASLAGGDAGNIVSFLLGSGGAQTVAQQTGFSQNVTNSVLNLAAPTLLSSLTGSGGSGILSMLGGLVGGSAASGKTDDMIATATQAVSQGTAAANSAANSAAGKTESKFWSFVASLFGKK